MQTRGRNPERANPSTLRKSISRLSTAPSRRGRPRPRTNGATRRSWRQAVSAVQADCPRMICGEAESPDPSAVARTQPVHECSYSLAPVGALGATIRICRSLGSSDPLLVDAIPAPVRRRNALQSHGAATLHQRGRIVGRVRLIGQVDLASIKRLAATIRGSLTRAQVGRVGLSLTPCADFSQIRLGREFRWVGLSGWQRNRIVDPSNCGTQCGQGGLAPECKSRQVENCCEINVHRVGFVRDDHEGQKAFVRCGLWRAPQGVPLVLLYEWQVHDLSPLRVDTPHGMWV